MLMKFAIASCLSVQGRLPGFVPQEVHAVLGESVRILRWSNLFVSDIRGVSEFTKEILENT